MSLEAGVITDLTGVISVTSVGASSTEFMYYYESQI